MSFGASIARFGSTYLVTRPGAGSYVDGVWQESGGPTTLQIVASIQPASNRDLQRLPEGQRSGDAIVVFTTTELKTAAAGGTLSDRIAYRGATYEVEDVEVWEFGGFYRCLASEMGQ